VSTTIRRPNRATALVWVLVVVAACSGGSGAPVVPSTGTSSAPASAAAGSDALPAATPIASEPVASGAVTGTDDASRTVALLDELAALDDPTLEELVAWFDKAFDERIADETIPAFFDYVRAREALYQAVQYGGSIRQPLADLLETRNAIAALAGIAAATPRPSAAATPKPDRGSYARPTEAQWKALIKDPEGSAGQRYRIASCISGQVGLDAVIGQSWPTWRTDYWEGGESVFTADEEIILAIASSSARRLDAFVTVVGWYTLEFRGGDEVPQFQLDDFEEPRACME
jgi:hypothetical protein